MLCSEVARLKKLNNKKAIWVIVGVVLLILCIIRFGVYSPSTSVSNSSKSSNKLISTEKVKGTYCSWDDGAAIELNSDGTGRYVFADPNNSDTDDTLTWKIVGFKKIDIKLNDPDMESHIVGTIGKDEEFNNNQCITLTSSDPNWNEERLVKSEAGLDLDDFLRSAHDGATPGLQHNNEQDGQEIEDEQESGEASIDSSSRDSGSVSTFSGSVGVISGGLTRQQAKEKLESNTTLPCPIEQMSIVDGKDGWVFTEPGHPEKYTTKKQYIVTKQGIEEKNIAVND